MQNVQSFESQTNRNLVWVDGDTVVRKDGERALHEELYGSGYTAKLNAFIAQREKALKEFEKQYKINKKPVEVEPEM